MRNLIILTLLSLALTQQASACNFVVSVTNDATPPVTVSSTPMVINDTNCATTQSLFQSAHGLGAPAQPATVTPDLPTVNAMAVEAGLNLMSEIQRIQAAQIQPMVVTPGR